MLAEVLTSFDGIITVTCFITEQSRSAIQGVWVQGGGMCTLLFDLFIFLNCTITVFLGKRLPRLWRNYDDAKIHPLQER